MKRESVVEALTQAYFVELKVARKYRMFAEVKEARKAIDTSNGILKAGEALGIEQCEIKHKYTEMESM